MLLSRILLCVLLCQITVTTYCSAQSIAPTKLNIDSDFRMSSVVGNKSWAGQYTGTVALHSGLADGWNVEVYGRLKETPMGYLATPGDVVLQQALIEREWKSQHLQFGLVRLPFGIYDYRETYSSGLIDYPLPRVDYGLNSVDWGVPGGKWIGGSPKLQVEAAAFAGKSSGVWGNQNGVGGAALRVQTYLRGVILGASHWEGYLNLPEAPGDSGVPTFSVAPSGRTLVHMSGIDVRFTRPHLLLRGEFLAGTLGDRQMEGWYLDVYYHLPKYQQFTIVARVEALRPDPALLYGRQVTLGVRYTAARDWTLAVNWRRNNFDHAYADSWTSYSGTRGTVFLQIYHKSRL